MGLGVIIIIIIVLHIIILSEFSNYETTKKKLLRTRPIYWYNYDDNVTMILCYAAVKHIERERIVFAGN